MNKMRLLSAFLIIRLGSVTDKGDGAVMPKIMFLYIRLCYSRFETDSPADFEEVAAIL